MSNLAYQIQQRRKIEEEQVNEIQQWTKKKLYLTFGEKLILLIFTTLLIFGSIVVVSNSAKIYSVNKDISVLNSTLDTQSKVISDLEHQVMELSTYERIWAKAHELGLVLNENNVKVVRD